MRFHHFAAILVLVPLLAPAASGAAAADTRLLFLADTPSEAAVAVSTGADVAYGSAQVKREVAAGKDVYEIGGNRTRFDTVPVSRLPELVNASPQGTCPEAAAKRTYAAMVASLDRNEIVCVGDTAPTDTSLDELKERYIRRIAATRDGINHVLVSSRQMLPAAAAIAADQHALLTVAGSGTRRSSRTLQALGFEDGLGDAWTMTGREHGTLTAKKTTAMAGKRAASLDADGSGSKTGLTAYRTFQAGMLEPGMTLQALVSFSHRDSHIPKIRYIDSSGATGIQLRFDPPGNNVWCQAYHGRDGNRDNFGSAADTGTVYRVAFTLKRDSVQCKVSTAAGDLLASTTVQHPSNFTYAGIDRVEIRSQDETPIRVRFDQVTVPPAAPDREERTRAVNAAITNATRRLGDHGMYLEGQERLVDGVYLSLVGVPSMVRQDPVEAGNWSLDDPKDGATFSTDLPYADFNRDGRIDAGVGRYPADRSLASRMYLRSKYYTGKQALVASEYLHANWPTILLYIGGGMFTGKSVEHILEQHGYSVSRAVEYRASPEDFLLDLTPVKLESVLVEADRVGEKVGGVLGQSVGTAASQVFVAVKAVEYIERTLEQYLEFDWSTLGLDVGRARQRLSADDLTTFKEAAEGAAEEISGSQSIRSGLVEAVKTEGVQDAVAKAVYAFFWPDRYGRLTVERLSDGARQNDVVYYNGVGNSSAWILPNRPSTIGGIVKTGRYNGTDSFDAGEVPQNTAALVFDNSDLAGTTDAAMRDAFLRNGAASYLGASTVNYAPFSSEIGTRFFRHGYTAGGSLKQAINGFRQDSLTWDPVNLLARNNVKGKMTLSFRLYGNPEMKKDPEIRDPPFNSTTRCSGSVCTLTLTADINTSIVESGDNRSITASPVNSRLLRSFRPVIPVLNADHVLPAGTEILGYTAQSDSRSISNVTVPVIRPLSHGGRRLQQRRATGAFPQNASAVRTRRTADGRTHVSFAHAAFQYHRNDRTATVYDRVHLELRYRPPYEMDIAVADTTSNRTTATVTVWNRGPRTPAEFLLRVRRQDGMRTRTFNTTLGHGRTQFNRSLVVKGVGRRAVDAYLFVGNRTVGSRTDTFAARRPPVAVNISVPGLVAEGERFTAHVTVEHRRGTGATALQINGSRGVQTVLLQPSTTRFSVPQDGSRVWRVPLRAFRQGDATITVRSGRVTERVDFGVEPVPRDRTPGRTYRPHEDGFRTVSTANGTALQIQRPDGLLRLYPGGQNSTAVLSTDRFKVSETKTPSGRRTVVERGDGSFRRVTWHGKTARTADGVAAETAARLHRRFLREKQKLLERYRIARNETAVGD
ncbi:MAG: hypothetical protein SVY41_01345 [Candidatus Nanohaloarchaea archaeon]|nr:hypothetical protein [Candidatus Nanohaloarchaea archaeon]